MTEDKLKTNEEIRRLWNKHSYRSLKELDLSNHYAALFVGSRFDLNFIFKELGIKSKQVFESDIPEVNLSLNRIDELLRETMSILAQSIKRTYFDDVDQDDIMYEYQWVTKELETFYSEIYEQLRNITAHIKVRNGYDYSFPTALE